MGKSSPAAARRFCYAESLNPTGSFESLARAAVRTTTRHYEPRSRCFSARTISICVYPDGKQLIVGSVSFATISVWRIDDGVRVRLFQSLRLDIPGSRLPILKYLAVTSDGRRVFSASATTVPITQTQVKYGESDVEMSEIRCWNLQTGKPIWNVHGPSDHGAGKAALSPDGKHFIVSDFGVLRMLAADTGTEEWRSSVPGCSGVTPVFSPDGSSFAMPALNTVALFDTKAGRRIRSDQEAPEGEFACAGWSPTGDRIVTGHADGEIRVSQTATGKLVWHKLLGPVKSPTGLIARPSFVTFSGDSRKIVAAGRRDDPVGYDDGIIAVYDQRPAQRFTSTIARKCSAHRTGGLLTG